MLKMLLLGSLVYAVERPYKKGGQDKVFRELEFSVDGQPVKFNTDADCIAKAKKLLLQEGSFTVTLRAGEYQNRTTFLAVDVVKEKN